MADIFQLSPKAADYKARLERFMDEHIYPNEQALFDAADNQPDRWEPLKLLQEIKEKAKAQGLWNLFLPDSEHGAGLTNLEYAPLAEIMGRSHWGPEVFNCSAPDTGNMEVLVRYGSEAQKERWLKPLLAGEIRSGFAMTEPDVASSDATNISISIKKDGDDYVINGRKWWTSGAGDPRCKILILMGKTDPDNADHHKQQSMILVPMDTPGVKKERMLPVFGYLDAPHGHGELSFTDVRVPQENVLLGEGRGFEIAQGRLGPGRIHHCMRTIGRAERALEKMCIRLKKRVAFRRPVADQSVWMERIAESRMMIDQARLLDAQGGVHDGHGGQQGRPRRDRDDQGRGAEHGLQGDRLGDPGAWRGGHLRRFRPALRLCLDPDAAHRRRPGRGAPQPDRQAGTAQIPRPREAEVIIRAGMQRNKADRQQ